MRKRSVFLQLNILPMEKDGVSGDNEEFGLSMNKFDSVCL